MMIRANEWVITKNKVWGEISQRANLCDIYPNPAAEKNETWAFLRLYENWSSKQ
jgi:hypothetical protein